MPAMTVAPAGVGSELAASAGGAAGAVVVLLGAPVLEEALPALAVEVVFEPLLLPDTDVLAENGLAPPEPQPTIEAMARAARLNLIKTLEVKPT
jgi:hypothetical protein